MLPPFPSTGLHREESLVVDVFCIPPPGLTHGFRMIRMQTDGLVTVTPSIGCLLQVARFRLHMCGDDGDGRWQAVAHSNVGRSPRTKSLSSALVPFQGEEARPPGGSAAEAADEGARRKHSARASYPWKGSCLHLLAHESGLLRRVLVVQDERPSPQALIGWYVVC